MKTEKKSIKMQNVHSCNIYSANQKTKRCDSVNATKTANYLIYIMSDAFDDLTNMKINKLLFYAQGHHISKYNRPMFEDKIEAWNHGPVVPSVYLAYKKYGDNPIHTYDENAVHDIPEESEEILYGVARKYGKYTASALRNMTHVIGSPWDNVYNPQNIHTEITQDSMKSYFSNIDSLTPAEKHFTESDFIGYRDKDGVLVLPKEWDDGEV